MILTHSKLSIGDDVKVRGDYRFLVAQPQRALELYGRILRFLRLRMPETEEGRRAHYFALKDLLARYHDKALVAETAYSNLIPTVGKSVLAQRLANVTTYTGIVNYAALGSGVTAPNISDTQLGTETYRQTLSSQTYLNAIAYLSCFIAAGSATGTHKEAGLFIDGAAGANTGQIFSHVAIDQTKGASNSLTLDISLTIS